VCTLIHLKYCLPPADYLNHRPNQSLGCVLGTSITREMAPSPLATRVAPALTSSRHVDHSRNGDHLQKLILYSVEHAADLVHWVDPAGRILYANESTCRRTGYTAEAIIGLGVWDLDLELTQDVWPERWEQIKRRGSFAIESFHRTRDGEVYPVELSINHVEQDGREYAFAFARDVSERKKAEASLRQSEERFRGIFEQGSVGIALLDQKRCFLRANPAFCRMLGYEEHEIVGKGVLAITVPEDEDSSRKRTRAKYAGDLAGAEMERRYLRKDGQAMWGHVSTAHLRDESGRPIGTVAVVQDITERKRAEQALLESEEQLRQAQKMEAIGQLAGGIAHDFNNVLTAILGYSEMILESDECLSATLRADVEEIRAAGERASSFTRQILAFSRRNALRPETLLLNDILAQMERLLRRTLGETIQLVTVADPCLGFVEVDEHQFEQVIVNLALNARDAMPTGGKLTLETANVELGKAFSRTHPGLQPGPYVMLAVSDTGLGMDQETKSHIFEPFFTTKPPGKGTGLGLATAYGVVRQSGGNIFVRSEPANGTTFEVYLPRLDRLTENRVHSRGVPRSLTGSETILVVEDEEAVRNLIQRALGHLGYRIVAVGSGDEALALMEGELAVDLLLTDVMLPGNLQGNDLAQAVSLIHPGLAVLYVSGYTPDAIVHTGRLDPGVNYVEKPFRPDELARRVRELLDEVISS
jgi:two-component system cell cycle sensor histidine kinase/response regulator CckA